MGFLDNYQPVEERIRQFWAKYPNGRLHTEIVLINETEIVIKASAFTDRDDTRPASIDFAQETRGSSNINKQSFVENGATSAIGRGLATLGFAPKGARPSREEMQKAAPKAKAQANTNRNWATEASTLALSKDLAGLRELYAHAKYAEADAEVLESIQNLAKALK